MGQGFTFRSKRGFNGAGCNDWQKIKGEFLRARMTPDTLFFNLGQELCVGRGT
jgi:hypothetical protein